MCINVAIHTNVGVLITSFIIFFMKKLDNIVFLTSKTCPLFFSRVLLSALGVLRCTATFLERFFQCCTSPTGAICAPSSVLRVSGSSSLESALPLTGH